MNTTNISLHWIAHFFEAKLTRPRPRRGQMLEVEAKILASRPVWPWSFNITDTLYRNVTCYFLSHSFVARSCRHWLYNTVAHLYSQWRRYAVFPERNAHGGELMRFLWLTRRDVMSHLILPELTPLVVRYCTQHWRMCCAQDVAQDRISYVFRGFIYLQTWCNQSPRCPKLRVHICFVILSEKQLHCGNK